MRLLVNNSCYAKCWQEAVGSSNETIKKQKYIEIYRNTQKYIEIHCKLVHSYNSYFVKNNKQYNNLTIE